MTAFVSHEIIAKVGVTCIDHIVDGMAEAHSLCHNVTRLFPPPSFVKRV